MIVLKYVLVTTTRIPSRTTYDRLNRQTYQISIAKRTHLLISVPQLQLKQQPRPIHAPATRVSPYIIELIANSICQGANCIIQYPQIPSLWRQAFTILKLAENVYLLQCISGISNCRSTDRHRQTEMLNHLIFSKSIHEMLQNELQTWCQLLCSLLLSNHKNA